MDVLDRGIEPAPLRTAVLREHFGDGLDQELIGLSHRLALAPAVKLLTPLPCKPFPALPLSTGIYEPIAGIVDDEQRSPLIGHWGAVPVNCFINGQGVLDLNQSS